MSETVKATFHADLSDHHPDAEYYVCAGGPRYPVVAHTDESRRAARREAPHLGGVPDERLTHVAVVPDLPAGCAVRVHLLESTRSFEEPAVTDFAPGHVAIFTPGSRTHFMLDYLSSAKALLFHHPDLATKDKKVAGYIHEHLDGDPEITRQLETVVVPLMRRKGPPRPSRGWAHLVPFTPPPRPGFDGKPRYQHEPIPEVREALGAPMTRLLKVTKSDPRLVGHKWHPEPGQSVADGSAARPMLAANIDVSGTDTWRPALSDDRRHHGLSTSIELVDSATRKVRIRMENYFIRYLGAYIRFRDAAGSAIANPDWKPESISVDGEFLDLEHLGVVRELGIAYDDCHYLGFISPVANTMAIPDNGNPGTFEAVVAFPENAVSASVYGSGLGRGSNPWPNMPVVGGVLTGLVNLGIPAYLLMATVADFTNQNFYNGTSITMRKKRLRGLLLKEGIEYLGTVRHGRPNFPMLTGMWKLLFNEGATELLEEVIKVMTTQHVLEAIPFAGWVLMALEIATGAAQIAETIVEIESSKWNIENAVATSITSKVTLHPDPRHHAFPQAPAGATSYFAVRMLMRDGRATRVTTHVVPPSTPKTLAATFADNTLGGEVCFEVDYLINSWIAGRARSGWIANDEPHATDVVLYLVENPKPLDQRSVYVHSAILIYEHGTYAWQPSATAPAATAANRSSAPSGNAISDWYGLALSQRYAVLGFAWKAAGMGIRSVTDGATGQLAAMQSVNIPGAEIEGAKFPPAGFDKPTQLMYDPYPAKFQIRDGNFVLDANNLPVLDPADKPLGDYYLDPRPGELPLSRGGGYHLRAVSPDLSVPFDLASSPSYGRFEFAADSFVMHPTGAVIAVSRAIHKMQILRIQQRPTSDVDADLAAVYAGQAMHPDRVGLLVDPVAVTCAGDGTIFVLESLKFLDATLGSRVQAFDLNGNSVSCFKADGGMSPFLYVGGPETTVLDVAAIGNEAATYLYVLSYENDGFQPSDYSMSIYTRGTKLHTSQPMVTTQGLAAAKIAVDIWHSLYALNYAMTTDALGNPAGPPGVETGPAGRTVPSVSEWLPPILSS